MTRSRPPREKPIPRPLAHHHPDCTAAGDCKSDGWCFGQMCDVIKANDGRAGRTAEGRCRTCRTRIFNREILKEADPTNRHPEGQP